MSRAFRKTEQELIALRKDSTIIPDTDGEVYAWLVLTFVVGMICFIIDVVRFCCYSPSLANKLMLLLPIVIFVISVISNRRHARKLWYINASTKYLTPEDLPISMYFDFCSVYFKVSRIGTHEDLSQLQELCGRATVEALRLKAAGVSLEEEEVQEWLTKQYTRACGLADAILKLGMLTTEMLAAAEARRKQAVADAARQAALAAFRERTVDGPFNFADWTKEGLEATNVRLEKTQEE